LAWSADYEGRLEYAPAEELRAIDGATVREGLVVVEPDAYGLKGKVLAETASASEADLQKALDAALKAFVPKAKDSRAHIREGERAGVRWETVIPVTDPGGPPRR
ncbi:MAG TPA: thioredoxin family protein, partial [Planctomycetota bacterium]|nr:thioredoxin family protein [Planctomycetota bacterium]